MIKAIKAFTSSLNAANRMGKAPIFLKHRAKNVGRVIAKEVKNQYNFVKDFPGLAAGGAAVGIGLGSGISYLTSKLKKKNNGKR